MMGNSANGRAQCHWHFQGFFVRALSTAFVFAMFIFPHRAAAAPLQYLSGAGDKAAPVVALTWGVLVISVAVTVIIAGLLAAAIWRSREKGEKSALIPDTGGANWLWIGGSLTALTLLITVAWTVKVLVQIQGPPTKPSVNIEVTGRQWWWRVRYLSDDGSKQFTTANEIHIPSGVPVRLKVIGGDVIHSFWVPQLAGKMDAIPGQTNETWIEADKPGIYSGQCTEYCGVQHSKMALLVVAQTPADFHRWWLHQLAPAQGQALFQSHCGGCHAVRGTQATGSFGPDLSHLMTRATLASGVLPNDDGTLAHWIADPQSLKPGNLMPAVALSDTERKSVHAYLKGLD
jgi:cytochrome c oxidase subunit 2